MSAGIVGKYIKSYNYRSGRLVFAFFVFISILLYTSIALAADITLTWNASSGATGYKLFSREAGQSYNYGVPDWQELRAFAALTIPFVSH